MTKAALNVCFGQFFKGFNLFLLSPEAVPVAKKGELIRECTCGKRGMRFISLYAVNCKVNHTHTSALIFAPLVTCKAIKVSIQNLISSGKSTIPRNHLACI